MSTSVVEELLRQARIVRELGARTPGTYLAEAPNGMKVVLETYTQPIGDVARRLCGLRHPHLVTVLSVERTSSAWSIATELVDGVPLADVFYGISLGGRLRAVVDVLTALSALHVADGGGPIVHCGVLLGSAFVDKSGRTKLGFAYRAALCQGTDSYAPEVLQKHTVDARTDVYGAGVLLWEALTGRPLFGDEPPLKILERQRAGNVEKALPKASDRWARCLLPVIERALAPLSRDRYATIAEMAAALRIAVRARLMFHDDIAEEIWPADTVPRQSSGARPAARPVEPSPAEPPTSEMKVTVPVPEPALEPEPGPEPARGEPSDAPVQRDVLPPPPSSPRPRWILPIGLLALAIVLGAAALAILLRPHHPVAHSPSATVAPFIGPAPPVLAPAPTRDPGPATPPANLAPTPRRAIKHPTKSASTFDPTTI